MKFKTKYIAPILFIGVVLFAIFGMVNKYTDTYNESIRIENNFSKLTNDRLTARNQITTILHESMRIANKNDSAFFKSLIAVTDSRKQDGLIMQWITENNPNANYSEVSQMYNQVLNSVKQERYNLNTIEGKMAAVNEQYANYHNTFPNRFILFNRKKSLNYEPLSTSQNKVINKTGVDNVLEIE